MKRRFYLRAVVECALAATLILSQALENAGAQTNASQNVGVVLVPAELSAPDLARELAAAVPPDGATGQSYLLRETSRGLFRAALTGGSERAWSNRHEGSFAIELSPGRRLLLRGIDSRTVAEQGSSEVRVWSGDVTATPEPGASLRGEAGRLGRTASPRGLAVITTDASGQLLLGRIDTLRESYVLRPAADGRVLVQQVLPSRYRPDHPGQVGQAPAAPAPLNPWVSPPIRLDTGPAPSGADRRLEFAAPAAREAPLAVIDVGVFWTSEADNEYSRSLTSQSLPILVTQLLEDVNVAFREGGVNARMRRKHAAAAKGLVGDDIRSMLRCIQDERCGREIHDSRARERLDLVVVLIRAAAADGCGLSAHNGSEWNDPKKAFAVVDIGCAFYQRALAHELGHLLGGRHDRPWDVSAPPFHDAHGYKLADEQVGDLMTLVTRTSDFARLTLWSNPTYLFLGTATGRSFAFGDSTANFARVLKITTPVVANHF